MIIFGVFVFAAVFTPSPDPISMLLLAVPCVVLVELAEVFAFFNDRRRAQLLAADPFPGLTPEEVAEFNLEDHTDSAIDAGSGPAGTRQPPAGRCADPRGNRPLRLGS